MASVDAWVATAAKGKLARQPASGLGAARGRKTWKCKLSTAASATRTFPYEITIIYEDFSTIRQALGELMQSAAQLGFAPAKWDVTPKEAIESFYKQDPEGNLEHIYEKLLKTAPVVQQAEAKLEQARRDLAKAELDLRYCDVVSEIDGVVTCHNVNPGNNVQVSKD